MITKYLSAALQKAKYEILSDGSYYGEIPGYDGVFANDPTLESCRTQLLEVLEEWILFRVSRNLTIPDIRGATLKFRKVA